MRYWSDKTRKFYESEKECVEAEEALDKQLAEAEAKRKELAEQRKVRAKEVEDAYNALIAARKQYNKLLNDFCKDFGSYHATFTSGDDAFTEVFDRIFRFF